MFLFGDTGLLYMVGISNSLQTNVIFKSPVSPKRSIFWAKVLAHGSNYEISSSVKLQMET
jgi:hypothetical protein